MFLKIVPVVLNLFLWLCIYWPYLRDFSVVLISTSVQWSNRAITKAISKENFWYLGLTDSCRWQLFCHTAKSTASFVSHPEVLQENNTQVTSHCSELETLSMDKPSHSPARAQGRLTSPPALQAPWHHLPHVSTSVLSGCREHALSSRHVCHIQHSSKHHWEKFKGGGRGRGHYFCLVCTLMDLA